jgi:uncharacterized protein (TIGR03435 family)
MRKCFRPLALFSAPLLLTLAVSAQTPTPRPAFEVASVKPAELDPAKLMAGQQKIGATIDAARVDLRSLSLEDLIRTAYRVKSFQVAGPEWLASQRFDIAAKLPEGAKRSEIPEMLQTLLEQRFHLTSHHAMKELPAFALVVAKSGAKLKESPDDSDAGSPNAIQSNTTLDSKGGVTNAGPNGIVKQTTGPEGMHLDIQKMSMTGLAELLVRLTDRPVADATDLKGKFDFVIDLSREELVTLVRASGQAMAAAPPEASGQITLAQSLERLGLKLETRKQSVEMLVIDRIEKMPTEN